MEWVVRIIGVTAIFGFAGWSVSNADRALVAPAAAEADPGEAVRAGVDDQHGPLPGDDPAEPGPPPEYLAYGPGFSSGVYRVADLPDSRDRDNKPRRGDDDDFVEFDLVPGQSLAERGELRPGLYATSFDTRNCRYELRRVMRDREERTIGEDALLEGRMLVTINEIEPDRFIADPACGEWIPWAPLVRPLLEAGDGDYWIGDLARGRWVVPEGCFWEKVVAFRGAELYDVVDSAIGPSELVVDGDTLGIRVRGCEQPMRHKALRR